LGWLIAASVRIMLLAIVIGLGESIWDRLQFTSKDISVEAALDVALAAILFMLLALISSRMASDLAMGTARLGAFEAALALGAAGVAARYASRPVVSALTPTAGWIKDKIYGAGLSAAKAAASMTSRASTPTPSSAPVPPATPKPPSTPTGGSS
jgi:type IV secretory pathway TrbL component